jgi:hypothetical protein
MWRRHVHAAPNRHVVSLLFALVDFDRSREIGQWIWNAGLGYGHPAPRTRCYCGEHLMGSLYLVPCIKIVIMRACVRATSRQHGALENVETKVGVVGSGLHGSTRNKLTSYIPANLQRIRHGPGQRRLLMRRGSRCIA